MKPFLSFVPVLLIASIATAQKVEYKDNNISVDGTNIATVYVIKGPMGLASTYKILSTSGDTLITAAYDDKVEENKNNNMNYYYKLTFMTTNQSAVFGVSKLGTEKSIAKLIGKGGIIVGGKLDEAKVKAFISKEADNSVKEKVDYTLVSRKHDWPIEMQTDKTIKQESKVIGSFKDVTVDGSGMDTYQFILPSGVVVATVSFKDGNNAQKYNIHTMKDNSEHTVTNTSKEKIMATSTEIDRNQIILKKIVEWLVGNQYL